MVAISYASSKAACTALTRALAMELAPYGINVTAYAPGTLNTKQFERIAEKGSIPFKMPPAVCRVCQDTKDLTSITANL